MCNPLDFYLEWAYYCVNEWHTNMDYFFFTGTELMMNLQEIMVNRQWMSIDQFVLIKFNLKLYVDEWWVINEMTWNLNNRWFCVLGMAVEGINVFWNGLIVPGRKKDQGRQVVQKIWIHACPCSNHQGLDWRSVWTIVGIKLSLGRLGGVLVVVRWIILKQKDLKRPCPTAITFNVYN